MILAVTGHRPPKLFGPMEPYSDVNFNMLVSFTTSEIKKINNIEKIITGMSLGFDQAVAQTAINLNIPFIAAIPFVGMESRWKKPSQDYFFKLLRHSVETQIISKGVYASGKFLKRDRWMVDKSDTVLSLYDGNLGGGTAYTVNYAKQNNKTIINIWDSWQHYITNMRLLGF